MADKPKDVGQKEAQKTADKETEQGFRGTEVDPLPNSAYSIQTGPESPTPAEQREALRKKESN